MIVSTINSFDFIMLLIINSFISRIQGQTYAEIKSILNGLCLGPTNNNAGRGNNVGMYTCNGHNAQLWYWVSSKLELRTAAGNCLDLGSGNPNNGAVIRMWDCNGAGNGAQDWYGQSLNLLVVISMLLQIGLILFVYNVGSSPMMEPLGMEEMVNV